MDPVVSWSRVRGLPFFNMSHIRQLMQGSPVYGYGNRDFVNRNSENGDDFDSDDEFDYDRSENMEDESKIIIPTFNELLRSQNNYPNHAQQPKESETEAYFGLSGDSLAFTLVYVSVFSVTLLYVGLKLAKRWRDRQSRRITASQPGSPNLPLPPCGHPQCARAAEHSSPSMPQPSYLPYTGLGAAWIPEMMTLQGRLPQPQPNLHNTAVCRGRCANCRTMALPPPSYTKLFLDELPPAYDDTLVIKEEEQEALAEHVDRTGECNSCTVDIECDASETDSDETEDASINSDQARTSEGDNSPLSQDSRA